MARNERRQAPPELRFSDEEFRAAIESTLDALAIISPVRDPADKVIDFRCEYVNNAYCALVGLDREQLIGHRFGELFPQFPGSDRFAVYRRVAEARGAGRRLRHAGSAHFLSSFAVYGDTAPHPRCLSACRVQHSVSVAG